MRAWTLVALALLVLPGCFADEDARAGLVPYPRVGDAATYDVSGALIELARWENGIPLAAATAQVRFTVSAGSDALDGSRALHSAYRVTTDVAEAGIFVFRRDAWVSERHGAIVQTHHPLSQDQSIVAFDERGFPWLFGASVLLGEDLATQTEFPFTLPDNLGRGQTILGAWRIDGREGDLARLTLDLAGMNGTVWMEPGSPWPARVELSLDSPALAPHLRSDGGYPATMSARRTLWTQGGEPVAPRDRGATFGADESVARARWDGEAPPDGDPTALAYPLSEAVREAKLVDRPLADWLASHDTPILYRGTYQTEAGPVDGSTQALWLLQWVDRSNAYYEVQIARVFLPVPNGTPLPPVGVPRVESSRPAEPPADPNHGWFPAEAVPEQLVTLSEGMRVVRETFGAQELQIFLRSFADPAGYSYFIDGGFEGPGRYTVVYHPGTGFIEQATGPVTPRLR